MHAQLQYIMYKHTCILKIMFNITKAQIETPLLLYVNTDTNQYQFKLQDQMTQLRGLIFIST